MQQARPGSLGEGERAAEALARLGSEREGEREGERVSVREGGRKGVISAGFGRWGKLKRSTFPLSLSLSLTLRRGGGGVVYLRA
jgi:hypothetical protein